MNRLIALLATLVLVGGAVATVTVDSGGSSRPGTVDAIVELEVTALNRVAAAEQANGTGITGGTGGALRDAVAAARKELAEARKGLHPAPERVPENVVEAADAALGRALDDYDAVTACADGSCPTAQASQTRAQAAALLAVTMLSPYSALTAVAQLDRITSVSDPALVLPRTRETGRAGTDAVIDDVISLLRTDAKVSPASAGTKDHLTARRAELRLSRAVDTLRERLTAVPGPLAAGSATTFQRLLDAHVASRLCGLTVDSYATQCTRESAALKRAAAPARTALVRLIPYGSRPRAKVLALLP